MVQSMSVSKADCCIKKQETKTKIRIVHIVAPEIIETNVENFRETVQRLTGKHSKSESDYRKRKPESAIVETRSTQGYLTQPSGKKVKLEEEKEPELGCVDNSSPPCDYSVVDDYLQEICEMPPIPLGSFYGDVFSEELVCV